jgi:hypothetical protein
MKPTGVLGKRSPPGDRHCEEQRVKTPVVKTLSEVAPGAFSITSRRVEGARREPRSATTELQHVPGHDRFCRHANTFREKHDA